jgi:hypothetical protein
VQGAEDEGRGMSCSHLQGKHTCEAVPIWRKMGGGCGTWAAAVNINFDFDYEVEMKMEEDSNF